MPPSLSNDAKDLIERLLQRNPRERPSLEAILAHPFLTTDTDMPGDFSTSLPSLSTARLKPFKKSTKYGMVEILANGGGVRFDSRDWPSSRVSISSDGQEIRVSATTAAAPEDRYTRERLPIRFDKTYRYLASIVELVRSKTPKVCV